MSPQRIQRRRTKGWRMPAGAVYVGRPGRWGNPFEVHRAGSQPGGHDMWGVYHAGTVLVRCDIKRDALADAVSRYRNEVTRYETTAAGIRLELAGRDLVCWCPLDQPCHADVLLALANRDVASAATEHSPLGEGGLSDLSALATTKT